MRTVGLLGLGLASVWLAGCPTPTVETGIGPTEDTDVPVDADGDGFDSEKDCDDTNPDVNPGQAEICNEIDDNCDGFTDEGFDYDGDGYYSIVECPFGDDCDDRDGDVNPGATEIPYNRVDEDCVDGDLVDVDGDGFVADIMPDGTDCNDDDPLINEEATEIPYDTIDQDCDGTDLLDVDMDGHDSADHGGDDCDDTDARINPSRMDWANDEVDSDCDKIDGDEVDFRLSRAEYIFSGLEFDADLNGRTIEICDWDGDGMDDVLVGAPFGGTYRGQISIFLAEYVSRWDAEMILDADPDVKIVGDGDRAFFGMDFACGDLNGDGRDDLVVTKGEINFVAGSTTYDNDFALLIYYGDDDWSWSFDEKKFDVNWKADYIASTGTGSSVRTPSLVVSDVDGDGKDDVLLGFEKNVWPEIANDTVYYIAGARYAGSDNLDEIEKITLTMSDPVADGRRTGLALSVVPDVDADGSNEIVVSQPYFQTDLDSDITEGRVLMYTGLTEDGELEGSAFMGFQGTADDAVGLGGVLAADVDGSGTADWIIAAPRYSVKQDNAGVVYVFKDPTAGTELAVDPSSVADGMLYTNDERGQLGMSMFVGEDFNADGKADIIVRQANYSTDFTDTFEDIYVVGGEHLTDGEINMDNAFLMSFTREAESSNTGSAFAVGDVTGDLAPDFFIGAPNYKTTNRGVDYSTGRAYFYPSESYAWGYSVGL